MVSTSSDLFGSDILEFIYDAVNPLTKPLKNARLMGKLTSH